MKSLPKSALGHANVHTQLACRSAELTEWQPLSESNMRGNEAAVPFTDELLLASRYPAQ